MSVLLLRCILQQIIWHELYSRRCDLIILFSDDLNGYICYKWKHQSFFDLGFDCISNMPFETIILNMNILTKKDTILTVTTAEFNDYAESSFWVIRQTPWSWCNCNYVQSMFALSVNHVKLHHILTTMLCFRCSYLDQIHILLKPISIFDD